MSFLINPFVYLAPGATLTASAGTFTLTGVNAAFLRSLKMAAGTGSFTISGNDAGLFTGNPDLVAETGTFTLTGNAAALSRALRMAASAGTFSLAGNAAALTKTITLLADSGSFTLTGVSNTFKRALVMAASQATFTLTGNAATLRRNAAFGDGALVVKSSNQSIATGTTPTVATWGSAVFDTDTFWSAGDPTKLTVQRNGYAQIYGGVRWESVSSATMRFCRPLLNGAAFNGGGGQAFLAPSSASGSRQCFVTPFVPVTAGDVFTLEVGHMRGSALNLNADNQTYFGIRFLDDVVGTMVALTANESIANNTATYVPWDTTIYDTLGAWSAGDPTKLTVPTDHPHRLRLYAGTRWSLLGGTVFIDIDRDTGSRPGGTVEELRTASSGFGTRQALISGLFYPEYDASAEFTGDSIPNDYLMQVRQNSGAAVNLNTDAQTYFAMESVPNGHETMIRLAADQTIGTSSQTAVTWGNNVLHDDYGIFDSGQSDRLTIPSGYTKALLVASVSWDTDTTGDRWVEFHKNGATFPGGAGKMAQASNLDRSRTHIAAIVPVTAGDYFQVKVWQNSGADRTIVSGSTPVFGVQLFP